MRCLALLLGTDGRVGMAQNLARGGQIGTGCPREVVDVPRLSVFKMHLDDALINVLYLLVILEEFRQLDSMIFVDSFQLNYTVLF